MFVVIKIVLDMFDRPKLLVNSQKVRLRNIKRHLVFVEPKLCWLGRKRVFKTVAFFCKVCSQFCSFVLIY